MSGFTRFMNKIRNGVYPAHVESLGIITTLVTAVQFSSIKVPFDLVNVFMRGMPATSTAWQLVSCFLTGFVFWIFIVLTMRCTLQFLLMYRGFMFETRGRKISLTTKVWGILVKFFVNWNSPMLYSFQGILPRLPLPSVEETIFRYLESVRPILDDADYAETVKKALEFKNGIANKLQRYLFLKSWWSPNYISDWWEKYAYLRSRNSLMIGSNIYGTDAITIPSSDQLSRAANILYLMLKFRERIVMQKLKPIMAQGLVPLCSWQYERMFNTARVPGIETDEIVHYEDSNHIVVLHKGCYYKMLISADGRLFNPSELKLQLDHIAKLDERSSLSEDHLASLTAWNRTKWAQAREKFFMTGVNKELLQDIESAAVFTSLDDEPFEFDLTSSPSDYGYYGQQILHGNGSNRWFDKSFTFCVGTNGKCGCNIEHTWADGPIMAHLCEDGLIDDAKCYDELGHIKGKAEVKPPNPTRMKWDFTDKQFVATIEEAFKSSQAAIEDVDHQILVHDAFGKGLMKKCRLSPDAFIQMALQLAYYRENGKFTLTYEASMTRLYREGRTETVRSCTKESCAWVRAMEDEKSNTNERVRLLNEACNKHQKLYLDAMCGRGVDRHLFGLYIVSKYLEVDSPFLTDALSEPWRLSTSQTMLGQTPKTDLSRNPEFCTAHGGFGCVQQDGYSVSYIVVREDLLFFHVSSAKSCETTNTDRFVKRIVKALNDMKLLFDDFRATENKTN